MESATPKARLLAVLEILAVYAVIQGIGLVRRSTGIVQWELLHLGWSYSGMVAFVGIPALVIWLTRRDWARYGVSLRDWPTNLDIGIKVYLIRLIPIVVGMGGALVLGLDTRRLTGGAWVALMEVLAVAVTIWVMQRQRPVRSGRPNLVIVLLLLTPLAWRSPWGG